jgi:protease I
MNDVLKDRRIAILATDGFEESELFEPLKALEEVGAHVDIISTHPGEIKAWKHDHWGKSIHVTTVIGDAEAISYDGLFIPGGVMNPDKLRMDKQVVNFVKEFVVDGKTIASICHGPQVLIETGALKGKHMTSWASLKTDLKNAGAEWEDSEVVVDENLITSRSPDDIPAFNKKIIEGFTHSARRV